MSDVSGIPNMGFGGGNFFAPQFSYNPQMSAGQAAAAYMPAENYAQNVTNNLFANQGGFGRLTDYYSQQVANSYGAINANYPHGLPPVGTFSDYNAGGDWPAGGGRAGTPSMSSLTSGDFGSPAWTFTNPSDRPAYQAPWDYSGGSFNLPAYPGGGNNTPAIDWSRVGTAAGGLTNPDPFPGMRMPGGLNQPMVTPQQQPSDYSSLFGRGAGGMSGAPVTPQPAAPSPPEVSRSSIGGLGGAPYTPSPSGGALDWSKLFGGAAPEPAANAAKSQEQPAFDFSGGNAGWGNAPSTAMPSSKALLGYEPQNTPSSTAIDWSLFQSPANDYTTFQGGGKAQGSQADAGGALTPGGGLTAADLAEQARGRLAELMKPAEPAKIPEPPGVPNAPFDRPSLEEFQKGSAEPSAPFDQPSLEQFQKEGAIPLPRERPEAADAPRPQTALGTTGSDLGYLPGRSAEDLKGVNPRFAKALQEYAKEYNASQDQYDLVLRSGQLGRTKGEHAGGNAVDVNLVDRRNGERLTDYQTRDPVVFKAYQDNANQFHQFLQQNYPDLAEVHRWGGYFSGPAGLYGAQDIMHHDIGGARHGMAGGSWQQGLGQQQADLYELPTGGGIKNPYPQFNLDWSNAPIKDVGPMPLTYKSPGGGSVYQYDPATGQKVNVPLSWDARKGVSSMGELGSRDFVPAAPIGGAESPVRQSLDVPQPPADIPFPGGVPLPVSRPAEANIAQAHSLLDSRVLDLVQKNSPADVNRIPSSIASQTLREALGNAMTGGLIRSGIEPYLSQLGVTPAEFDKAIAQGRLVQPSRFGGGDGAAAGGDANPAPGYIWPQEGTPRWNAEIYEPMSGRGIMQRPENQTVGGAGQYDAFTKSGNVEDRRAEALTRDQLAALKARGVGYAQGPEPAGAATNPLSAALGLGNLPVPTGAGTGGMVRPGGVVGDAEGNTFDERFPFDPTTFQSPVNDYNTFQQGRSDLAAQIAAPGRMSMDFGGFSPSPEPRKGGVGPEMDAPTPEFMQTIAKAESDFNPNQQTGRYKGLYQLSDKEFRDYGGRGSIFDPDENARVATLKMMDEGQKAQDRLGRALTPVEQYMVHQQGLYGTLAHLANPDQTAWKSFQQASGNSEALSKTAIWKNMTPEMKNQFGNDVNNVTSRDFINLWADRYNALQRPGKQ
jgi:hypothetical protein